MPAVKCPHCGKKGKVPERLLGRKGECSKCGEVFRLQRNVESPVPIVESDAADAVDQREAGDGCSPSDEPSILRDLKSLYRRRPKLFWVAAVAFLLIVGPPTAIWLFRSPNTGEVIEQHPQPLPLLKAIPSEEEVEEQKAEAPQPAVVRVRIWDDTESRPLNPAAEIWFKGSGSWYFQKESRFGGTVRNLARRQVDVQSRGNDSLYIYPDGRAGKEISIPIMMTPEMNPNGSDRDAIDVTITDTEVDVAGLPLKGTLGELSTKIDRN